MGFLNLNWKRYRKNSKKIINKSDKIFNNTFRNNHVINYYTINYNISFVNNSSELEYIAFKS